MEMFKVWAASELTMMVIAVFEAPDHPQEPGTGTEFLNPTTAPVQSVGKDSGKLIENE